MRASFGDAALFAVGSSCWRRNRFAPSSARAWSSLISSPATTRPYSFTADADSSVSPFDTMASSFLWLVLGPATPSAHLALGAAVQTEADAGRGGPPRAE